MKNVDTGRGLRRIQKAASMYIRRDDIADFCRFAVFLAAASCVLYITGIGCLIRFVTGISCPGCGISRALIALLKGDIASAFYYHPLFWLPMVIAVLWFFRRKWSRAQVRWFLIGCIILYLAVYMIRMVTGSNIVVCRPQDGMIVKGFNHLFKLIQYKQS